MPVGFLADVCVGKRTAATDLVDDDRFEQPVVVPDFLDDARCLVVAAAGGGENDKLNRALGVTRLCVRDRRIECTGEAEKCCEETGC